MIIDRQVWEKLSTEFNLTDDYSGRGMFGEQCVGVIGRTGDLLRFSAALQRAYDDDDSLTTDGEELIDELASAALSDSMGFDTVYYFPGVTVGE